MKAEVISVGTELLLGDITDTNATFIAQELRKIGLDLIFRTTVGDNEERIAAAIESALNRVDIVITTGGLGPTVDDVTREAIGRATNRPLEFQQVLLDQIADRFQRFGVKMTDNNRRQAYAPRGARLIENPVGTAPIFILETERGVIMTLPGVPREMQYLLQNELIPWLKDYLGAPSVIKTLVLRTAGIGESQIDAKIADLMTWANPTVGLAAHPGQADIRITAKASTEVEAEAMIAPVEQDIRQRVGEWIYGTGEVSIEEALLRLLDEQHASLAAVEGGTDGYLQQRLTGIVAQFPGVPVVCEAAAQWIVPLKDAAEAAAIALRKKHDTTYALAGFMQTEGQGRDAATEVGVAAANADKCFSRSYTWKAQRPDAPIWVTTHCMALLWRLAKRLETG